MAKLPEKGTLTETPLPRLLLELYRAGFSGGLALTRESTRKRVILSKGIPLFAESNLASESLGVQLMDAGQLSREDYARVVEKVEKSGCKEGAALLQLGLLAPKELFLALKDQVRRRVVDAIGWARGEYALEPGKAALDEAQAFRLDPLELVREGLERSWGVDRLLAELAPSLGRYPTPTPRLASVAGRLGTGDETLAALCAAMDGTRTLAEAVRNASSPDLLAAIWMLEVLGAVQMQAAPPRREEAAATPVQRIEVVVDDASTSTPEPAAPVARRRTTPAAQRDASGDDALRQELLERHAALDDVDHYGALGIERDAAAGAIKRAYLNLAKRIHPDALRRVGMVGLLSEANEVFARVSKAYEVLSDPERRSEYDAAGCGDAELDAQRLAEAETFYRKAEMLMKMGNFNGAVEFLEPAVKLWPDEPAYHGAYGWTLFKKRPSEPKAAREQLEHALSLAGEQAQLLFRLGIVLRALGETEAAETHIARAKHLDPKVA